MRYIEWLVLFVLAACGTGLANLIGYGVGITDSLTGEIGDAESSPMMEQ